jgi:hypothetical protein
MEPSIQHTVHGSQRHYVLQNGFNGGHAVSVFRNRILKIPALSKDEGIQKWKK